MRLKPVLICLASGAAAVVVACGDDGGTRELPDAPPTSDVLPDTPDPPTPARITITRDGEGVENVDVYFQAADSSLIAKVATDANGVAEAVVMPGAYVTVVNAFRVAALGGVPPDEIQTIAGVQPGDELRISRNNGRRTGTFVNVIADPDPDGSQYELWSTCLDVESSAPYGMSIGSGGLDRPQVGLNLGCTTTADILVESGNGSGSSVGWIFVDNAPLTPDGTIDITGPYTASAQVDATFDDIPDSVTSMSAQTFIATSDGVLWTDSNELSIGSNSATWSFPRPAPAGSTQIWYDSMFGGGGYGQQQVIDWKPIADPATFSFAGALLREVTTVPSYDVASHAATWSESATGVAPDLAVAELTANRTGPPFLEWRWTVASAPTGSSVVFPVLPAEIAKYNAVDGDSLNVFNMSTAKVPGGYNAVRPFVFAIESPIGLVTGASGRVVIQHLFGRIVRAAAIPSLTKRAAAASR